MRWQDNKILCAVPYQSIVLVVSIVHVKYCSRRVLFTSNIYTSKWVITMSPYTMSTNLKRPRDKLTPHNQPVTEPHWRPDQLLLSAEAELVQSVNDLKVRNRIFDEL